MYILLLYGWWKTISDTQWAHLSAHEPVDFQRQHACFRVKESNGYWTMPLLTDMYKTKMATETGRLGITSAQFQRTRFRTACLTFDVDHYQCWCRTYVFWIGRTRKYRYSHWNFKNVLFQTEGFTISCLRRHLGFSYVGPWQHISIHPCYNYEQNKYTVWAKLSDTTLHFCV